MSLQFFPTRHFPAHALLSSPPTPLPLRPPGPWCLNTVLTGLLHRMDSHLTPPSRRSSTMAERRTLLCPRCRLILVVIPRDGQPANPPPLREPLLARPPLRGTARLPPAPRRTPPLAHQAAPLPASRSPQVQTFLSTNKLKNFANINSKSQKVPTYKRCEGSEEAPSASTWTSKLLNNRRNGKQVMEFNVEPTKPRVNRSHKRRQQSRGV